MPTAAAPPKPLRRDAASSRARILQAAGSVFAERGFDVPLSQVAAAAGVGVATLSRHFTRPQLVQAVAEQRLVEHNRAAEDALALPATEGVASYLRMLCERRLVDRSVCHAITLRLPDSAEVARLRAELRQRQLDLIDAGQKAKVIRAGVVPQDLLLILEAVQSVMEATTGDASWERLFAMLQAGLAPNAAASVLPDPPRPEELLETRSGPSRGRRTSPVTPTP